MYVKGSKVLAKVTNITPFGAFYELKNTVGLIHISEISVVGKKLRFYKKYK